VRLKVAVRAVGVDKAADLGLLVAVDDLDPGGGCGSDGVAGVAKSKTLEKRAPGGVNRIGIVEPSGVGGFKDIRIGAGRERGIHDCRRKNTLDNCRDVFFRET
jgi:hypothetical protein